MVSRLLARLREWWESLDEDWDPADLPAYEEENDQ